MVVVRTACPSTSTTSKEPGRKHLHEPLLWKAKIQKNEPGWFSSSCLCPVSQWIWKLWAWLWVFYSLSSYVAREIAARTIFTATTDDETTNIFPVCTIAEIFLLLPTLSISFSSVETAFGISIQQTTNACSFFALQCETQTKLGFCPVYSERTSNKRNETKRNKQNKPKTGAHWIIVWVVL